jgi:hypothetical protein
MDLAEAFPAKELESRPLAAVRTFGEVLRHIAFWNLYVADSLRGKQTNDTSNELPLAEFPTKERILEELKKKLGRRSHGTTRTSEFTRLEGSGTHPYIH